MGWSRCVTAVQSLHLDRTAPSTIMSCSLAVVTPDPESGDERSIRSETANAESSKGRRGDFESLNLGSSPSTATKEDGQAGNAAVR